MTATLIDEHFNYLVNFIGFIVTHYLATSLMLSIKLFRNLMFGVINLIQFISLCENVRRHSDRKGAQ